jgi:threonine/homoserine/homoserine lactone efflux protein
MDAALSSILAALAVGLAVASAPGPVQAIVVSEAMRGGIGRGVTAAAGAAVAFGLLLILLALGVSIAAPSGDLVRLLQAVGGVTLLWFAFDGYRSASRPPASTASDRFGGERTALPAPARVGIAVLVFPGTWIFTAGVASPLITAARSAGGQALALGVAAGLVAGTAVGNLAISVLAGWGRRVASERTARWIRKGMAIALGAIGLVLLAGAVAGIGRGTGYRAGA